MALNSGGSKSKAVANAAEKILNDPSDEVGRQHYKDYVADPNNILMGPGKPKEDFASLESKKHLSNLQRYMTSGSVKLDKGGKVTFTKYFGELYFKALNSKKGEFDHDPAKMDSTHA